MMKSVTALFLATCLNLAFLGAEEIVILGNGVDTFKGKAQILQIDQLNPDREKLDLNKNPISMTKEDKDFFNQKESQFKGCLWIERPSSPNQGRPMYGELWCVSDGEKNNMMYSLKPVNRDTGVNRDANVRAVWSFTIPSIPMNSLHSVLFKVQEIIKKTYSTIESYVLIRDAASKKYYISSQSVESTGELLMSPESQWREISSDLQSIDETAVPLTTISVDLVGLFRSYERLGQESTKLNQTIRPVLNFFSYSKNES